MALAVGWVVVGVVVRWLQVIVAVAVSLAVAVAVAVAVQRVL